MDRLKASIVAGLRNGEFVPYFHPQICAGSFKLVGLEVLVRWTQQDGSTLTPADFLPAVQRFDLMSTLDSQVADKAFEIQEYWRKVTGTLVPLSLNLSQDRLNDPDLVTQIETLGPRSKYISLELLETIDLDHLPNDISELLHHLRRLGVKIEIDDFGTGKTSILALTSLRPNRLKLDKQLVKPALHSQDAYEVLRSIVSIAQTLNISVTAEGVETLQMVEMATKLGCDRLQGFYFGEPKSGAEIGRDFYKWL